MKRIGILTGGGDCPGLNPVIRAVVKAAIEKYGMTVVGFKNGYKGLYNGETAESIAKRKGLKNGQPILDYMGSAELGANIFRITQTDALLKDNKVNTENEACNTHNRVGKAVRKTIADLGGTMPENLPTPEKSVKELEKENNKQLKLSKGNTKKLN